MEASTPDTTRKSETPEKESKSSPENMGPFGRAPACRGAQSSKEGPDCPSIPPSPSKPACQAVLARRDKAKYKAKHNVSGANIMSSGLSTSDSSGSGSTPTFQFSNIPTSASAGFGGSMTKENNVSTFKNVFSPSTPGHGCGTLDDRVQSSSKPFDSPTHGFGSSDSGVGLSSKSINFSGIGGHVFSSFDHGASKTFDSSNSGGPSKPGYSTNYCNYDLQPPSNPFSVSTSSTPKTGFGSSTKGVRPSRKGFGSTGWPSSSSSSSTNIVIPSTPPRHVFGTRAHSAALDDQPAFGATSAPVSDNTPPPVPSEESAPVPAQSAPESIESSDQSIPALAQPTTQSVESSDQTIPAQAQPTTKSVDTSDQSAPAPDQPASKSIDPSSHSISAAPAPPSMNPVNACLLKAIKQLVVTSEAMIPEMKMLEILVQTHAGLITALERARIGSAG